MAQNSNPQSNPVGSNPNGVDLLGQSGNESENHDPTDASARQLKAIASLRQSVTRRGGQPQ
jgi:hypothetical protein